MDFRVLVADDEKTALDSISFLLEKFHHEFHIVGKAGNGREAMQLARELQPDLMLTDIRMPHMDGLELIDAVKHELPDVYTIIISGHSDFEYVRRALITGSIDYLLKPLDPPRMQDALARARPFLIANACRKRTELIRQMEKGVAVSQNECERYFPEDAFVAAISRKNGLPNRLPKGRLNPDPFFQKEGVIGLYGRDDLESLCVLPAGVMRLEEITRLAQSPLDSLRGYTTTIICNTPFPITQVPEIVQALYKALNRHLVVGKSQTLSLNRGATVTLKNERAFAALENGVMLQLPYRLTAREYSHVVRDIETLLEKGEELGITQWALENTVRNITNKICTVNKLNIAGFSLEMMIEDVFYSATTHKDLSDGVLAIVNELLQTKSSYKLGNKVLFEKICDYIDDHLTETLALQSLCGQFGISQPTLSRLFREHAGMSFNRFLTQKRMEKAMVLLTAPAPLIHEVAEKVGYTDQFYFSRIFRSFSGMSPSEYVTQQKMHQLLV